MLADAIHAGLNAVGRSTIDAGTAATPTTGVLVRQYEAAGGIQISASHNPLPYNGMKLFSSEGRVIPKAPGEQVRREYETANIDWVSQEKLGTRRVCDDTTSAHLDKILETVDVAKIRDCKFNVVLDSNRGAGSILGHQLLEALGCNILLLGGTPDGRFEHAPEPTEDNLAPVFQKVKEAKVDIGFCQDPDADRLAVIDAGGRYLGEEYTVALCIDHVLSTREKGPVVINCATSRMSMDIAQQHHVSLMRSAVGEANVVDLMKSEEAIFGGEGNGGPIDPNVGWVRDSFVGMAQLLEMMAVRQSTIAELADALPRYAIVKTKIELPPEKVESALALLEQHFDDAHADRLDGLRLDWPDSWLLVRPSNTEPIVRAIAEASTEEEALSLCRQAAKVIQG